MLLRVKFEVDIVQKSDLSPEIHFISKAQLPCIPAHHPFHRQRMLQVKRVFVILSQQLPSCLSCNLTFHYLCLFYDII